MFSNKFYCTKVSITLIIILGSCLYSLLTLRYSEQQSGGENVICKYRLVSETGDKYFRYDWNNQKITVHGDIPGIKKGDYVSFSATPIDNKNLKLHSFHIHKYRVYSMYLSIPPVVIVFLILIRKLSWSKRGLTFA